MQLDHEACHRALQAHDPRFDGLFFVGVSSTGIYCRCVCSARTPKPENCTFYRHPAEAEKAGYRPCLLCRPEIAPGRARVDAVARLASAAYRRIEDGAMDEMSVGELAAEFGVTERHLRRAVNEEYGVSPVELAQTQRLLMAKRLLTDTDLAVGEVAMASGFASLRRFNALFSERYRLSPTALRKTRPTVIPGSFRLELAYREPYDWEGILRFLGVRAIPGVESIDDGTYRRTVSIADRRGWITVRRSALRPGLIVEIAPELGRVAPTVIRRVRRLFDTAAEPASIADSLGELARDHEGIRVPGAFDGFEAAVRAILGQQVSVAAARTFAGRLVARLGEPLDTPFADLTHSFPNANTVACASLEDLIGIGLVGKRAATLHALASSGIRLVPGVDVESTLIQLRSIPGIGEWTAQYIAMRALSYPDAFPHADLGILKALGTKDPAVALRHAEAWKPWRAYATLHLWRTLENPS